MARLVDVRRVVEADPAAFALLVEQMSAPTIAPAVTQAAIVHGAGLNAALAAGFTHVTPMPFPVALFTGLGAALDWLAAEPDLEAEIERLHEQATGIPLLVRDVRAFIRASLRGISLPLAAAALGLSARGLQRRLRAHGITFRAEVDAARVEAAQTRMIKTDATLAEIASDVGLASANRFGDLFRRVTGESPASWRKMRR
jgi:AraC-like DNA-binding protein